MYFCSYTKKQDMSFTENKKYTFSDDTVVKGVNKPIFKEVNGKSVRQNPELVLTKKFKKGTVVDATYMSGRGMNGNISFTSNGGILPNGSEHTGEVTYTIQFQDTEFKKPILIAEVIKEKEEEPVESQQRGEEKKMFTPNNIALGVIGLIAIFVLLKATKVIK